MRALRQLRRQRQPIFWCGLTTVSTTVASACAQLVAVLARPDNVATGERVFEGRAESVSRSNRLQTIVPNLVEALFTDFPGNSGETLRITIKEDEKTVRRTD